MDSVRIEVGKLSPLTFAVQRNTSQMLEKDKAGSLSNTNDLVSRRLTMHWKTKESIYKLSKGNAVRVAKTDISFIFLLGRIISLFSTCTCHII